MLSKPNLFSPRGVVQPLTRSLMPTIFLFLLSFNYVLAQVQTSAPKRISGKVVSATGDPLENVTVNVNKPVFVTTSNAKGEFTISADDDAFITFSSVGFLPQTIKVAGQTQINVVLQSQTAELNQVVVVGYNTQSKRKITSAVVTVSGEDLNKRVAPNPATLLQGQLPGLQVTQNSGEPGNEGVQLRIRGVGTFSGAGNDPLVIVDGLPGSLNILNPNDIESITVLKDAASAAIYGSRGANGVIVVKTKKGKGGGFNISYNYNIGIQSATALPDLITNSAQFMELSNEARLNSGLQPLYTQDQIDQYRNATDRVKYPNHNWLNDVFKTTTTQNHYLNASGGRDNTTYSLGIGLSDQDGIMIGFEEKKYTVDFGLSSKVNKRVTIGTNIQMRYSDRKAPENGSTDMFLSTLAQSPLYPPRSADGRWIKRAYPNELGNKNTVAIVDEDVRIRYKDYYTQGNLSLDVDIIDGLKWENRAGINYDSYKFNDFRPTVQMYYYSDMSSAGLLDVGTPGLNVGRTDNFYTVYYSQLNFRKQFGDHNVSALAGYQQEYNNGSNLNASRTQFPTNVLRELDAGPANGQTNSGTSSEWAIRSYYGNVNYDFQDKYLLGGSLRYDGTSRLPSNSRWGLFYSFSGGWRISKESFLENVSWLNDLKLRGSWGQLGNQNIGNYPYQPTLDNRSYAFGGTVLPGFSSSTLVDPSLRWETTRVIDLGFDLTVMNNRLNISADWFNKYTFDILRSSQVPLWLGLNAPTINDGALRNKGFEVSALYKDMIGKSFTWSIGGNIQRYVNKLEHYGKTEISYNSIRQEGHPLDEFYLYQWDGIFQSQDEINKSPVQPVTPTPGDLKIKDVNGDNKIDANDRTYTSGRYPAYQYAINLSAGYKGFDLSAQFFGSQGQKIYVNGWGIEPFRQGSVPTTDWLNRWTPTNHTNTMPKIYVADNYPAVQNYPSTYFLKDASFFRLKNIQLGYTVPTHLVRLIGLKVARFYFTADNVFTISKFPGLDPERASASGTYVGYPQNKIFTFGTSIQF
ncbi:SusC/RagA family TonB-linked outer membrane protein [Chitinophaga tropicalis]|uniref:SusC/RagA family TonB-linked outer membrane protein n=1 Tax=Chitinophaga tropicalis TaxID=2683588 RepID=A0A7K1U3D4_9BACT|nr:TonB-dependent receptor [Chitinophaga tropicalis]MVT08796.1 SusC/RagA family TonB-linked outer membrane protein [Chitinophaga tropicalis]